MRCKVWCRANPLIHKSQNGLQSRLGGFDSVFASIPHLFHCLVPRSLVFTTGCMHVQVQGTIHATSVGQ